VLPAKLVTGMAEIITLMVRDHQFNQ